MSFWRILGPGCKGIRRHISTVIFFNGLSGM